MKFDKEFLREEVVFDYPTGTYIVEDTIIGHRRWSVDHRIVFKDDKRHPGKFFTTTYSVGATEGQDESPFEYDDDPVECPEVRAVERTVTVYEPVETENTGC